MILLSGFADDLDRFISEFGSIPVDIQTVTENATEADIPEAAEMVVYVFSEDTGYSSQLHSIFTYVHDRVQTSKEYLLALGNVDLDKSVFPEISDLPKTTPGRMKEILERAV